MLGIHHAQGGLGSTGVYLLKLKNEGVVVLKQKTQSIDREYFAMILLRLLNIRAPSIRTLPFREFKELSEQLRPAPVTIHGTCLEIHGKRYHCCSSAGQMLATIIGSLHNPDIIGSGSRMQEAGGVLMEFVPGVELSSPRSAIYLPHGRF